MYKNCIGESMTIGRPPKFCPEVSEAILRDISAGVPYKIAAEANDIGESTLYSWLYQGLEDVKNNVASEHRAFLKSLREIERDRIANAMADIRVSEKGHRGREWELERSFWKHFSSHAQNIEMNDRLEALEKKEKS